MLCFIVYASLGNPLNHTLYRFTHLQVNDDPNLLAGHHLDFLYADINADTLVSTARTTEQWRDGAIAFFGPEDTCDVEARVAAAWNLPMIAYVSRQRLFLSYMFMDVC